MTETDHPEENETISTLGAAALIFHENKVLLVQMNYGKGRDLWILPGGMVNQGEYPEDAAFREVKPMPKLFIRKALENNGGHVPVPKPEGHPFRDSIFGLD